MYALCEPETGEFRYVGYAVDPIKRLKSHWDEGVRHTHKSYWLRQLRAQGQKPVLRVIEEVSDSEDWRLLERSWIRQLRLMGCRLTNGTDGGEGGYIEAAHSSEARAKRAASNRGQKRSEEYKQAAKIRQTCKFHSAETKAKLSEISRTDPRNRGESKSNAKLTDEKVREIRSLRASGIPGIEVARLYGVTPALVSLVHLRRAWAHVS